jgi:hypothetical protein
MNGMTAAILVVLGVSTPLHAPDLQVEAVTEGGTELPELADAVARALVAGGARVVLRGPSTGPCEYCAKVRVTETEPGVWRVDVTHQSRAASTTLRLPTGSQMFDRARAIAIQARLLVTWEPGLANRSKETAARPPHKSEASAATPARRSTEPRSAVAAVRLESPPARTYEPSPGSASGPPQPPPPWMAPSPPPSPSPMPPPVAVYTPRGGVDSKTRPSEVKPSSPSETRVAQPDEREPARRSEAAKAKPRAASQAPPAADLVAAAGRETKPRWPWIPTALGAGAAIGAGVCGLIARNRHEGLADKTQPYSGAQALKSSGERWQLASFVLSGVAAVGLGTGIVGFSTRSSGASTVVAVATPIPGGGVVGIAGGLP